MQYSRFCYFFQASGEGKSDNDNGFEISWATHNSWTILYIFASSQLFSLSYNLVLYSRNKLSQKYPPHQHISPLQKAFEKCKPVSLFSRICDILFQSSCGFKQSLVLRKTVNITKFAIRCRYALNFFQIFSEQFLLGNCGPPLSYVSFHILRNSRLQKGALKNS